MTIHPPAGMGAAAAGDAAGLGPPIEETGRSGGQRSRFRGRAYPQKITLPTMPVKWSTKRNTPPGVSCPRIRPKKNGRVLR